MNGKRIVSILFCIALTLGLSLTVEYPDNKEKGENTAKKSATKKSRKYYRDFDFSIFPEISAPENNEKKVVNDTPYEDWEEYPEEVNKYDVYDPQAVWVISKMFPRTKIKLSSEDIFAQIKVGDYFLERTVGAEESYTLTKWVKDDLEYQPDDSQFHVTKDLIEMVKEPDGSFTLRMYGEDLHTSYSDKETLAQAILEYVTLKENLFDSQSQKYQKSGKDYMESMLLKDYYLERLRRLEAMKIYKWNFIPTGKEFQDMMDSAISDTLSHINFIEMDIEANKPK